MVDQWVGLGQVVLQGVPQGREGDLVKPEEQLGGVRGGENLVEQGFQVFVRHGLEAKRRLAHLANALPQGGGMLGAIM